MSQLSTTLDYKCLRVGQELVDKAVLHWEATMEKAYNSVRVYLLGQFEQHAFSYTEDKTGIYVASIPEISKAFETFSQDDISKLAKGFGFMEIKYKKIGEKEFVYIQLIRDPVNPTSV